MELEDGAYSEQPDVKSYFGKKTACLCPYFAQRARPMVEWVQAG